MFGSVPTNDKQTPLPLSFDPTLMKDAQCAETNEKLIFRFLFMELLQLKFPIFSHFCTEKKIIVTGC